MEEETAGEEVVDAAAAGRLNRLKLRVNEAQIAASGIETNNGIIYAIDRVLLPPVGQAAAPAESVVVNGVTIICSENYVTQEGDWLSRIAESRYNDP